MSVGCIFGIAALALIVIAFSFFEFHYFLRMGLCVILARFVKRKCYILEPTVVSGVCLTNDIDALLYHMNNARFLREIDFARVDFYERTSLYRTIRAKGGSVFQGAATIRYRRFIRPFHRFQIISRIIYWDSQSIYMEHRFIRPADKFVHAIAICRQRFLDCSAEEIMQELLTRPAVTQTTTTTTGTVTPIPTTATATSTATASTTKVLTRTTTTATTHTTTAISMESNFGIATTFRDDTENGELHVKLKPDIPAELVKWIEYNELSSKTLRPS